LLLPTTCHCALMFKIIEVRPQENTPRGPMRARAWYARIRGHYYTTSVFLLSARLDFDTHTEFPLIHSWHEIKPAITFAHKHQTHSPCTSHLSRYQQSKKSPPKPGPPMVLSSLVRAKRRPFAILRMLRSAHTRTVIAMQHARGRQSATMVPITRKTAALSCSNCNGSRSRGWRSHDFLLFLSDLAASAPFRPVTPEAALATHADCSAQH
jgi:hypothetical protein